MWYDPKDQQDESKVLSATVMQTLAIAGPLGLWNALPSSSSLPVDSCDYACLGITFVLTLERVRVRACECDRKGLLSASEPC